MRLIHVDELNYDRLYAESTSAIKDFLYMLYGIAGDCRPYGDWSRAELGDVDPFDYLDIAYECKRQLRADHEVRFMREAAALNLLCRLAIISDEDDCSGSTWMADFSRKRDSPATEALIRQHHPELYRISEAFDAGRIVPDKVIQRAFRSALNNTGDFLLALQEVTSEVVLETFAALFTYEGEPEPGASEG